jgi:hypothetical protein
MCLTEELLIELTGLKGRELSIFYLMYKKQAPSVIFHGNLEYIKQDIIKFRDNIYNKKTSVKSNKNVKSMIELWESKIIR